MVQAERDVAKRPPSREWLPRIRRTPILDKPFNVNFIKAMKARDWFLTVAAAMVDEKHIFQAKMMAKVYLFLRDYMPRGLTGRFSHIQGDDVMSHLLCYTSDQAISKHRISRDATDAFTALEQWMEVEGGWKQALEVYIARNTEKSGHKRKVSWWAPGLLSPAGAYGTLS